MFICRQVGKTSEHTPRHTCTSALGEPGGKKLRIVFPHLLGLPENTKTQHEDSVGALGWGAAQPGVTGKTHLLTSNENSNSTRQQF